MHYILIKMTSILLDIEYFVTQCLILILILGCHATFMLLDTRLLYNFLFVLLGVFVWVFFGGVSFLFFFGGGIFWGLYILL